MYNLKHDYIKKNVAKNRVDLGLKRTLFHFTKVEQFKSVCFRNVLVSGAQEVVAVTIFSKTE